MKTRLVRINGELVPVIGAKAHLVVKAPKFQQWIATIDPELVVEKITVEYARFTENGLLFAILDCQAKNRQTGNVPPGIVFLRGGAIAILLILIDALSGKKWVVTTDQLRVPIGKRLREIPAGMLDARGNFAGKAAEELQEETGLVIKESDLIPLGDFYPSAGGCDEIIFLFYAEIPLTSEQIEAMQGSMHGNQEEHEEIVLHLCLLGDLPQVASQDSKALVAFMRYNQR